MRFFWIASMRIGYPTPTEHQRKTDPENADVNYCLGHDLFAFTKISMFIADDPHSLTSAPSCELTKTDDKAKHEHGANMQLTVALDCLVQ